MPCAHEVGAGSGHIGCAQQEARRIVGIRGRQLLLCGLDLQPAEAKSFLLCPSHAKKLSATSSHCLCHLIYMDSVLWGQQRGQRELDRSVLATLKWLLSCCSLWAFSNVLLCLSYYKKNCYRPHGFYATDTILPISEGWEVEDEGASRLGLVRVQFPLHGVCLLALSLCGKDGG